MKKIILGIVAVLALVAIYFLVSPKVTSEIKATVQKEIASLEQYGFGVKRESLAADKDKYILSFDDTKKIGALVTAQTSQVSQEFIDDLAGMEVVAQIAYAQGVTNAVSAQLYPHKLPTTLLENNATTPAWLNDMIEKKVVTMFVDVDKTLTNFKGGFKDIDYTIPEETPIDILLTGSSFKGKLKDMKISTIAHTLNHIKVAEKNATFEIKDVSIQGKTTGPNRYDTDQKGTIGKISFSDNEDQSAIHLTNLDFDSSTIVKNNLLQGGVAFNIEKLEIASAKDQGGFSGVALDVTLENIDIDAIDTINNLQETNDNEAILAASKRVLSSYPIVTIKNFSIKEIVDNNTTFKGLVSQGSLVVDKDVDIDKAFEGDMEAFAKLLDINAKLDFSKESLEFFGRNPSVGMMMMLFAPKEEGESRIYTIRYYDGLTINGQKVF